MEQNEKKGEGWEGKEPTLVSLEVKINMARHESTDKQNNIVGCLDFAQ